MLKLNNLLLVFLFFTTVNIFAQEGLTVKGKITDENGDPMIGVNVLEKGTTNGTVTNIDGDYRLTLGTSDATLVFTYIGYLSEELPVNGQETINLQMIPDLQQLDELVVIGYGRAKKSNVLGAIASVSNEDIEDLPVSNIEQALQGKAAGVQVTSNSGAPGGKMTVRVRGMGTLNSGTQPLYVVDGFIMGDQSFGKEGGNTPDNKTGIEFLDPNEIESIEILKDASATAIYGARGANGVVLITTKKGKAGAAKVNVNMYRGFQELQNKYDIMEPEDFRDFKIESYKNSFGSRWLDIASDTSNAFSLRRFMSETGEPLPIQSSTDWQDRIINTGSLGDRLSSTAIENYNISVSGGNEKNTYLISGTYFRQEGLVKNSGFKKYSIRLNGNHDITDNIRVGENLIVTRMDRNRTSEVVNVVPNMLYADPTAQPYNEEGNWTDLVLTQAAANPVGLIERPEYFYVSDRILGSAFLDINILPSLVFHSTIGLDVNIGDMENWLPEYQINPVDKRDNAIFRKRYERWDNWDWENTLTYNKAFGDHDVTAMVGYTAQKESFVDMRTTFTDFPYDEPHLRYPSVPDPSAVVTEMGSSPMAYSILSYLGRVMYSYKEKLLLNASLRRDGSSKFGDENLWGNFPGASAGYVLSKEPFLANSNVISFLKFRVGWGVLGNQAIPAYQDKTYNTTGVNYNFGLDKTTYIGVYPNGIANPNYRWERTIQQNVAVDLGLFRNQIDISLDFYRKLVDGILLRRTLPMYIGVHSAFRVGGEPNFPFVNAGEMKNTGFEAVAGYKFSVGPVDFNVRGNFSASENEVLSLAGADDFPSNRFNVGSLTQLSRTVEGRPVAGFYGYVVEGIFQDYDEIAAHAEQGKPDPYLTDRTLEPRPSRYTAPGDFKFKDINGDGIINAEDKDFIGNPLPDFLYGGSISANFKGFDFSMFLQGVYGNDVVNTLRYNLYGVTLTNKSTDLNNAWSESNKNTDIPRVMTASDPNNNMRFSSFYVQDGSYMRIKNLIVGYTLPGEIISIAKMSNLRIYFSAQNLLTISKYNGYDPEIGNSIEWNARPLDFGVDNGNYPLPRIFTLGLNASF
jgi:TonB-linked SusC/RagA family outer membrane protein